MLKALIVVHRYLGVVVGIVMLLWCLSGFVMMYQSFPDTSAKEREAGLTRLDLSACCNVDAVGIADDAKVRDIRLEMLGATPMLSLDLGEGPPQRLNALTGKAIEGFGEADVRAVAMRFAAAKGIEGEPKAFEQIVKDQWSVANWKRAAPVWRATFADRQHTYVYVSGKTGEVFQDANGTERFLSWLGAIPHWLYPTILRADAPLWSQVVIWSSTVGVFLTVTGMVIGFVRLRGKSGKWWPYRRPMWLIHHTLGVFGGVLVLTWTFSGLLTMSPWGLFESPPGVSRSDVRGQMTWAQAKALLQAAKAETAVRDGVRMTAAPLLGEPFAALVLRDGSKVRVGVEGVQMLSSHDFAAKLETVAGPLKGARLEVMTKEDAYYYSHHSKVSLPVLRLQLADADKSRVYLDATTGEVARIADATAKRYRWLEAGFHSFDWPVIRSRPVWDAVVIVALVAMSVICGTGAWLGMMRIGRDVGTVRRARSARGAGE